MRVALLIALLATLAVGAAALELNSQIGSQPSDDLITAQLSKYSPCAQSCAATAGQCHEDCVFTEVDEADSFAQNEFNCRAQCVKRTTRCLKKCAANVGQSAAVPPTFTDTKQPRPFELNQGYGPETVKNWAGYVSVNGSFPTVKRHLWYWAFESRNDPANDPLVIWLTGGPGCSSLVALFKENGPYLIDPDTLALSLNPSSWNSNATVIWIDQPVGTGYSYADKGDLGVTSEDEMAANMIEFMHGFFAQYPQYAGLDFFITGESYAGHYIPAFANAVLQNNQDPALPPIRLAAIAIGNGLVDPAIQYTQYAPFAAATGALPNSSIAIMQAGIAPCVADIAQCGWNSTVGLMACLTATETCNLAELMPFQLSGKNVYDIRIPCEIPGLCYNFSMVDAFLAQPAVISALGVAGLTWQDCSHAVNIELVFAGDWMRNLAQVVPNILASGVRVIAYSGEYDFICNWYGGNAWTNALVWPGQQAFQTAQNTTWLYNGEEAGSSRTADGFTFVRVKDAGHMVPLNQPERALDLLARVINGQPFDGTPAAAQAETPVAKENPAIALE